MKLLGVLGLLCLFNFSCTQQRAHREATSLVETWMEETHAVGVSITVGKNGEIIWSRGFGYADLEQGVPVDPGRTLFRVGSVAKPMTTAAVGLLVEQERLDLDAPIQKYVPAFPEKEGVVTARLLAGHLGGIRHYQEGEYLSHQRYETVLDGLAIFEDDPLLHPPGSQYSYSSYGYNLLSAVIEGASGQDFLSYMKENVFKPLGMSRTVADQLDPVVTGRGRYYWVRDEDGAVMNAPSVDNSYKWAGGGFISTSEDLVRFGFAYLGTDFLKQETIELLWNPQKTVDGEDTGDDIGWASGYGIGWASGTNENGRSWVGHNGGSVGGTTVFRIYPEKQLVIALISNRSGQKYKGIPDQIVDLFWE